LARGGTPARAAGPVGRGGAVGRRTAGDLSARRRTRQERGGSGPRICWRVSTATWPPCRRDHPKELARLPGIGPAKAAQLAASLELARRALAGSLKAKDALASPEAVRDWLRLSLGKLQHEVFVALWLDAQNRLIASEELFRGTLTQTSVYPREVVKRALACITPAP
jgi:hypothetical protein